MTTYSLFPSYIYHKKITSASKLNKGLLHDIHILKQKDLDGLKWSKKNYVGGYTSYDSINDLHLRFPDFIDLEKEITKHVNTFVKKLGLDLSSKLEMTDSWVSVMNEKTYHTMHIHPLSIISGTYYIDVPKDSSSIKFEDPRLNFMMASPPKKPNHKLSEQNYFNIQPKAGDLVLFESWLKHEVPPNLSKKERITFSFNYA